MKMRQLNAAMFGLTAATLLACSSAPSAPGGTAGTSGSAGSGTAGSGTAGEGTAGSATAGSGTAGEGTAGAGTAGSGTAGTTPGTAGSGTAGSGTAGAGGGTAGSGAAGAGTAGTTGTTTCPTGVLGHCNADTANAPTHAGYQLALAEEFDAPIDLDADPIWTWSDGAPADGQTRLQESAITFAGGKMIITASSPCAAMTNNSGCIHPTTAGGDVTYAEAAQNSNKGLIQNMGVWSGEFRTKYNNYRYGWYEAKYHAPIATNPPHITDVNLGGDFLSTMFVFRTPKWSTWNEIDVELEPNHYNQLSGNVVNIMGRTGYPNDSNDAFNSTMGLPTGYNVTDEHTYAIEWTPTVVNWYVDGVVSKTYNGTNPNAGTVPIPTKSAKIMANLWVFSGTAFGDGQNNHYPFSSEYEYLRFYKLSDATKEPKYPCSPTPSCLTADDLKDSQNNSKEINYGM
jgi:hypothetical protein